MTIVPQPLQYLDAVEPRQFQIQHHHRRPHRQAAEALQGTGAVGRFMSALRTLDAAPIIRDVRARADVTKAQTLEQARRMLASGKDHEALEFLANTLTNRLLHAPSRALRLAAEQGDADLIEAAQKLYGLDHEAGH